MSQLMDDLAAFVASTGFSDLPPDLVARAKRHILDTFGATLAGSNSPIAQAVQQTVAAEGCTPLASVWGCGWQTSPRNAAWLNGVAAHMYELDDTGGCDHSGAVVLPAVMALIPQCAAPVSGQALITAVVLGYDVGRRVLEACGGYAAHNEAGWHSTATCGVFGAAAAAASLLQLNQNQTAQALGIAASFSSGLWGFIHDGSQSKKLHAGRAAEGGVLAALLAAKGITGPGQTFDDVWGGFLQTFAPASRQPAALTAELGQVWKLNRCSIKPYASCRGTHSAIDAVGLLMAEHNCGAEQIARIDVYLNPFLLDMCGNTDLQSLAAAQMSLPYALAARVLFGHAGLDAYDSDKRASSEVAAMLDRITLHIDQQQGSSDEPVVELQTRTGERWRQHVAVPLGAPANPLSDTALLDKFTQLANRVLTPPQTRTLQDYCLTLEQQADISELLALLK
ncbi:MmgE/PrpD family protein [Erwiniaceae bacterium BAC15a-03b]|uniref:MmgE/PrpD family protein n=1 Tax=Winslowiella arboricola TaxID=2978220 RepID=A0A9J6PIA6_9GAMM|nr:MmgE/PrpD family protein [Winslowiella arboricola]MCU5771625.1 MmgE/PrpD family protein [Winslowiella arboricola]MCU5776438.1 MmgE/PrpD family protein [Winslowiella arboricola]